MDIKSIGAGHVARYGDGNASELNKSLSVANSYSQLQSKDASSVDITFNSVSQTVDQLNGGSERLLRGFSNLGAWWASAKGTETKNISLVSQAASMPKVLADGHVDYAARAIMKSDGLFSYKEAVSRVPKAMKQSSLLSRGMAAFGGVVDAATGVLDLAEAYNKEGGAGLGTLKQLGFSTAKTGIVTYGGTLIAGAVGTTATLPLLAGIAGGVALGYGVDQVFSWLGR